MYITMNIDVTHSGLKPDSKKGESSTGIIGHILSPGNQPIGFIVTWPDSSLNANRSINLGDAEAAKQLCSVSCDWASA